MIKRILRYYVKKKLGSHEFRTLVLLSIDAESHIDWTTYSAAYDKLIKKLLDVM